jgi:proline dehydrogenase
MLEGLPKAAFSMLASSHVLSRLASRYGMRRPDSFARRFIAGETTAEAIEVARTIERGGMGITLDYLGEQVMSTAAAASATQAYLEIINEIEQAGIGRNLSVKLTQLGLSVDRATSVDNLRRILDAGGAADFFVRIDMEQSSTTDQIFDAVETLWNIGYHNSGIAVQAYLRRSAADIARLNALGISVRLVKGAYNEPAEVAFPHKADVDAAFVSLMQTLLEQGNRPAIATHDPEMIERTIHFAERQGISKDRWEFEMLYGVRRDLQTSLTAKGYSVRLYVPFGRQWFPYFMRRLGERPANVTFVFKSLFREHD